MFGPLPVLLRRESVNFPQSFFPRSDASFFIAGESPVDLAPHRSIALATSRPSALSPRGDGGRIGGGLNVDRRFDVEVESVLGIGLDGFEVGLALEPPGVPILVPGAGNGVFGVG